MDKDTRIEDLELHTRSIFDAHHREQLEHGHTFPRLVSLVSASYFGLPESWFEGKTVLDAGCGSNANASVAFLQMGAARVDSVDLGEEWMEVAQRNLHPFGDRSAMRSESVLDLSMANETYDFVHCAGVLHHTADPRGGALELCRVTRPSGYTFISVMANAGGVLYQFINMLRSRYKEDPTFRKTIDELSSERISSGVEWILGEKGRHEFGELVDGEDDVFRSLFDPDIVLTIKDRLQAPTYHDFDFTESEIRSWFLDSGYVDAQRISRYTTGFHNFRRFLAPMYLNYDHPVSRFWFGEGYVQMIGRKPGGAVDG